MHGLRQSTLRAALLALAATLAPATAAAQDRRVVVLQNLAPFRRHQVASVVVPFRPGVAKTTPRLTVDDRPTVWQPFGARWPDGSWRQALAMFEVTIERLSEVRLALLAGDATVDTPPPEMPTAKVTFVVRRGDQVVRAEPRPVRELERNAMRRVELRRARLGQSGLVAELIVTAWRECRHADVTLAVFCSDPDQPAMQCDVTELAVECRGMGIVLRHAGYHGVEQRLTAYGSRTVLLRNEAIGDGQGIRRTGVMIPPPDGDRLADETLRAVATVPLLAATSWRATGAFGPFGEVAPPPPWLAKDGLRNHFARRHRTFVRRERPGGDPFGVGPHGLQRMAGQTGDQEDFGVCKLSPVAWSGIPSMLLEVEASVLQEACRPVHFFERDASPVDPAKHPDWVVWSGRTHWHPEVSKDRLGKPV
ncbi:MAG TPA: hypothetical protein ENI87_07300, partial [bacterium]|nr:hypothetical protein [bacterium]